METSKKHRTKVKILADLAYRIEVRQVSCVYKWRPDQKTGKDHRGLWPGPVQREEHLKAVKEQTGLPGVPLTRNGGAAAANITMQKAHG